MAEWLRRIVQRESSRRILERDFVPIVATCAATRRKVETQLQHGATTQLAPLHDAGGVLAPS